MVIMELAEMARWAMSYERIGAAMSYEWVSPPTGVNTCLIAHSMLALWSQTLQDRGRTRPGHPVSGGSW